MKKLAFVILLGLAALGCGKTTNVIPNVAVNFELPVSDPRLKNLTSFGGAVIVPGYGIAGLLLYRESDGTYAAYDACSSYMPQNKCAVTLTNSIYATDPCSGSEFYLADGTVGKGPASLPLKVYSIFVQNGNIYVSN